MLAGVTITSDIGRRDIAIDDMAIERYIEA